jgi:DNA-binding transcriptional ArsR family regulator
VENAENCLKPMAEIASAFGASARARILMCLMDRQTSTSTELAAIARVGPSTASAHLHRLQGSGPVRALQQGKHRYYSLSRSEAAAMLEPSERASGALKESIAGTMDIGPACARRIPQAAVIRKTTGRRYLAAQASLHLPDTPLAL